VSKVVAYVPDLMDRSKVAAAATDITFVNRPQDLAGTPADLYVIDLMRPGAVEALGSIEGRIIGFARHTEPELMKSARAAGCETVLARSAFFVQLESLLA
jgi:hypothetical protein